MNQHLQGRRILRNLAAALVLAIAPALVAQPASQPAAPSVETLQIGRAHV